MIYCVKELKELIADLPDDTIIVAISANQMELPNTYEKGANFEVQKMKAYPKECIDSFDDSKYETQAYSQNDKGEISLVIN